MITFNVEIPFSGFYCSVHDEELDHQLETYLTGYDVDGEDTEVDWGAVRLAYSVAYSSAVKELDDSLNGLEFNSLTSPKAYNFSTDRIHCDIPAVDILNIYTIVTIQNREQWVNYVHYRLKPCDGFAPFYSNDFTNDWPLLVSEWEPPQISLLLEFYIKEVLGELESQLDEYAILEDYMGNGGGALVEDNIINQT